MPATRLYAPREMPKGSGKIVQPPDLTRIAQAVGKPGRQNCGACHFNGGGGDAVKHGDLDTSLIKPSRAVDVHMSPDGENMSCADCHTFNAHQPSGSRYAATAKDTKGVDMKHVDHNRATCESCHDLKPHKERAPQQPRQPRGLPDLPHPRVRARRHRHQDAVGLVDRRQARPDGKPLFIKDDHGHLIYSAEKGDFKYGENVRPTYKWYNGVVHQIALTDKIDDSKILELNRVEGSASDPNARIWPFKVMVGKQPYDPVNKTLVVNHVYGKDDTAFWGNFDYAKSIKAGMDYAGLPYSGQFGFIETRMNWFITHMVAPKEEALRCRNATPARKTAAWPRSPTSTCRVVTATAGSTSSGLAWRSLGAIGAGSIHGIARILTRRKGH
jgi:octaheme c-type cytochrome (tetrathionate reductase family)